MKRRRKYDAMRHYKPHPYAQEAVRAHLYRKHRKKVLAGVLIYSALTRRRRKR